MSSLSEEDRCNPWFDDGNVIIAVQGKYFRVHRGVLSSYSTVFKDMFSCSKPDDPELPMMKGCPVVTLYDTVVDVQTMLLAMYDRGYASPAKAIPFPMLSVFLRLGKKYLIHQLFDEGRMCLEVFVKNMTTNSLTCSSTPTLGTNIIGSDKYNFQIINLAREVGLLSVLPVIMFLCALSCPVEYMVEGYNDDLVEFCKLSPENQRACIVGRDKLPGIYSRLFKWLRNPKVGSCNSYTCSSSEACHQIMQEVWADSPRSVFWDSFKAWDLKWDTRFCSRCRGIAKDLHQQGRQQAWEELPLTFGLADSWEELERATFSCDRDETS